jgi:hypothetical protein
MTDLRSWVARKAHEDDLLYEQYGKPLEREHTGEYAAIGSDGRIILGTDELSVALQAEQAFGAGAFALRRVGHDAELRWRTVWS